MDSTVSCPGGPRRFARKVKFLHVAVKFFFSISLTLLPPCYPECAGSCLTPGKLPISPTLLTHPLPCIQLNNASHEDAGLKRQHCPKN